MKQDGELSSTMNRYIVIDSITPLLGPQLSAESAEGHAAMVNFMRYLRNIARNYGVLFFVSCSTVCLSEYEIDLGTCVAMQVDQRGNVVQT